MKRLLATAAMTALAVVGLAAGLATTGLAADPDPPNQGDPDKVLTVPSGYACSGTLVAGAKIEGGGLGRTITVSATTPIVQVTIKSGSKAELVSATWSSDYLSGTITISQDVSNYVVWTCTGTTTTTETTPTTTETTPTTTETTQTTTESTQTTTETTQTTTETTPTTTETTPTTTGTSPTDEPAVPLTPPRVAEEPAGGVAPAYAEQAPARAPQPTPAARSVARAAAPAQPQLAYTP